MGNQSTLPSAFLTAAQGVKWPKRSLTRVTASIGFMGTKMPLDHRARKRFEGFTRTLAKAGIEIADQEFYSGGSALAKGP